MPIAPGSLLLEPILTGFCTFPLGTPEGVAIFDVDGSILTLFLLREKKDVDWEGIFEAFEAVDVIEDFRERPTGGFSFDSGAFSVCLAERKPNAPREAMVAVCPSTALSERKRWMLWATWAMTGKFFLVHVEQTRL